MRSAVGYNRRLHNLYYNQESYLHFPGANTIDEVLTQNKIQVPPSINVSEINQLQSKIQNEKAAITTHSAEIMATKERIVTLKNDIYQTTNAWNVAARVAGTALLVFAYAVLAVSVIGIAAIIGLESANSFETVSQGSKRVYLRYENEKLTSEQIKLAAARANEALLSEFSKRMPTVIATLEQQIEMLKETKNKITSIPDTRPFWKAVVNCNERELSQYQMALELFKQATVA